MSSEEVRKVSRKDIQLVQNLIERCLQLYMSRTEVVSTLLHQAKIEPGFTELVWQKLEEENQEFFREYHLRLIVKDQIIRFNQLLEQQAELMRQMFPTGIAAVPMPNGSRFPSMHHNVVCHASGNGAPIKAETMAQDVNATLPAYNNGGSLLRPCMQSNIGMSSHPGRVDTAPNMLLAQSSNVGLIQGMNGGMVKPETDYVGNTAFMFSTDGTVLDPRPTIRDATVSSFSSVESNTHPLNEAILDADTSSFGFLGQIPRNFSLSDLTADFSSSSDILESYSKSPFLAADPDFLDPHARGDHQGPFP